jgi:glycosyltransferase involved in cell wall biosynthesis
MRILQTPPRFYPYVGGVETVAVALSRALVTLGHDVTVICADEPPGGPTRFDGADIHRLWYPAKVANTNITPALPMALWRTPFDVIHTHLPTPWSADWSVLIGRARRKGVVLTYYNDIVGGGGAATAIARLYNTAWLPVALALAHRVVFNSASLFERPGTPLKAVERKACLVPNGVDTRRFYPKPELRTAGKIGFLAVLDDFHRYKGLDVLLRSAQELDGRGLEGTLLVGGSGALRSEYERLAASLGLVDRVRFLGFVPDSELLDFFNGCQVFVLPTTDRRREGFGLVVVEAMACGVPVVVTSAAGVADVVRETGAGIVVPPGDTSALTSALERLLTEPGLARQLGERGRKATEKRFDWTAIARRYEPLYEEAMAIGRRPR